MPSPWAGVGFAAALAICAGMLPGLAPAVAKTALPAFAAGGMVEVRAVLDGQSLLLADGREVRLVGIEAPTPAVKSEAALAGRAKAALASLVARGKVELRFAGNRTDRHDRVLAQLFAGGRWVQRELLQRGLARVHGLADNRLGLPEMLAVETRARQARRGIWATAFYAIRRPEEATRDAGTFQIIQGKVTGAVAAADAVYLHFGADPGAAVSLRFAGEALKLCRAAGLDPRTLTGARLRARGFIEGGRLPLIEVTFPEQIERL